MALMAHPVAMAKTLTSRRNERGVALLEAVIALALVSLIAATTYSVFSQSASVNARSEARLSALAQAESGLELASSPAFLANVLTEGEATLSGEGWHVRGARYEDDGAGPLALIRLLATAGPPDAPLITLETLRAIPK